jgi:hypothetical protein
MDAVKLRLSLSILIFAAALRVMPARAQEGPSEVQQALTQQGATVVIHRRTVGDPYLDVLSAGIAWRLYFVECRPSQPSSTCNSMTMQVAFSHADKKNLATINAWNATKRYSRAFLDEDGDPTLATDVLLTDAPARLVGQELGRWLNDIERFRDFVR